MTEQERVARVPATFANRFQVVVQSDGLVRLVFGEVLDVPGASFHTAILMTRADVDELASIIQRLLGESKGSQGIAPVTATGGTVH